MDFISWTGLAETKQKNPITVTGYTIDGKLIVRELKCSQIDKTPSSLLIPCGMRKWYHYTKLMWMFKIDDDLV